jgi:hypothetical protein
MMHRSFEPGLGGVVSLEPQPFLHGWKAAPKSQWVTVEALWYGPSDWLEALRRIWGRFEGKGAMDRMSPFPVASSAETIPPVVGSNSIWLRPKACIGIGSEKERREP